jgi:hypothetical protein
MNKIAPVLLQKYFQVSRERYVFKEQSKIRLANTYIHLIIDGSYHLSQTVNFVQENDHQYKHRRLLLIISMSLGELLFFARIIQRERK